MHVYLAAHEVELADEIGARFDGFGIGYSIGFPRLLTIFTPPEGVVCAGVRLADTAAETIARVAVHFQRLWADETKIPMLLMVWLGDGIPLFLYESNEGGEALGGALQRIPTEAGQYGGRIFHWFDGRWNHGEVV